MTDIKPIIFTLYFDKGKISLEAPTQLYWCITDGDNTVSPSFRVSPEPTEGETEAKVVCGAATFELQK
jgi:hypothetical protein